MFQTVNPATGQVVQSYSFATDVEIQSTLQKAHENFNWWRQTSIAERASVVQKLAAEFRAQKNTLAELMTLEMGKTQEEGLAEIEKCAVTLEYFAEKGPEFLKPEPVSIPKAESEIHFEPLGVILSIMPWNFPFWQFVRFAAPSLMIGNVIVLKHSTITAGCAQKIEEMCRKVVEKTLIFNLRLDHEQAAKVMGDPAIRGVTFTGSTAGGREIAKTAGQALKKTVLELGGSDAYLVLADADIPMAAKKCAAGRMINNGQSCVAAKRFIVVADVFDSFVKEMKTELAKFKTLPLAQQKFKIQLLEQVQKMQSLGGKLLLGGEAGGPVQLPHAFFPPSLLVFQENHPGIHQEELFGPVAMVIKAKDTREAITIANASPYGLGGGIFSGDEKAARELARKELEAGFVVVNDTVRSDARLPFGGVKNSGYGRELSLHGFREFCNIKTVLVGH
jgi:succinate-semialdehyde dehydrogenase/glutarate-semialdehyde dehydrogenase